MKVPTKAEFERAKALVNRYNAYMFRKEQEEKATKGKIYVGKCFKFENNTSSDDKWVEWIRIQGVDSDGYDVMFVKPRSDYGEGYTITRGRWTLGMDNYFKDEVTEKAFMSMFESVLTKITRT